MPKLTAKIKELVTANMRQSIIAASREIITQDGIEGLTMEKLAHEAGISTGSIYNYFANKEAIVGGIMKDAFMNMLDAVAKIASGDGSAPEKLICIASFMLEDFQQVKHLHEILMQTRRKIKKEKFARNHGKLLEVISNTIKNGVKDGSFRDVEPVLAASAFLGMIREIQFDPGMRFADEPVDRLASNITDIFIRGIAKVQE